MGSADGPRTQRSFKTRDKYRAMMSELVDNMDHEEVGDLLADVEAAMGSMGLTLE